jgi:hypothetical protein
MTTTASLAVFTPYPFWSEVNVHDFPTCCFSCESSVEDTYTAFAKIKMLQNWKYRSRHKYAELFALFPNGIRREVRQTFVTHFRMCLNVSFNGAYKFFVQAYTAILVNRQYTTPLLYIYVSKDLINFRCPTQQLFISANRQPLNH